MLILFLLAKGMPLVYNPQMNINLCVISARAESDFGVRELPYIKDVEKVYQFANYLYKIGKYESAITEYERVIFLGSSSTVDTSAIFSQIGKCYLLLNDYETARNYLSRVENDTAYALIGFSILDSGDNHFRQNLLSAKKVFTKIKDKTWQQNIEIHYSKLQNLPTKSPLIAGLSSAILPGSGRVYSGRWGDGISSFLFVIGSFALAYHYYEANNRWAGIGFGGLSILFYLGDIYGSIESAKLYNEKAFYDELDKFKASFGYLY